MTKDLFSHRDGRMGMFKRNHKGVLLYDPPLPHLFPQAQDRHLRDLVRGSSLAFALRIVGMAMGYLFTLLVARTFGAGALGLFSLSITMLNIFSVVGRLGLDTALLKSIAEYASQDKWEMAREMYGKSVIILVPFCLFLSVLSYLLSPLVANQLFHKAHLALPFRMISFAIFPLVLTLLNAQAMRALKNIAGFSFFHNIAHFLFASIVLSLCLFLTRQQYLPILSYVIAIFFSAAVSCLTWMRNPRMRPFSWGRSITVKSMLSVSFPMLLSSSMLFLMHWIDTIMLGMFRSEAEVGIFNVAVKVATFTSAILFAINSIAAPKFAELYGNKDMEGFRRVVRQSTKLIFWTSAPILLLTTLIPAFILGIFGPEFKVGVTALILLAIGQFINAISGSVGFVLQMTGRQRMFQNIVFGATGINILLNLLLIPSFGMNGTAIASMAALIFWNLCSVWYVKSQFHFLTIYLPFPGLNRSY